MLLALRRTLAADVHVSPGAGSMSSGAAAPTATDGVDARANPMPSRRRSVTQKEAVLGDRMAQSSPVSTGAAQLSANRKGRLSPPRLRPGSESPKTAQVKQSVRVIHFPPSCRYSLAHLQY